MTSVLEVVYQPGGVFLVGQVAILGVTWTMDRYVWLLVPGRGCLLLFTSILEEVFSET
jgi:hypothetical protein